MNKKIEDLKNTIDSLQHDADKEAYVVNRFAAIHTQAKEQYKYLKDTIKEKKDNLKKLIDEEKEQIEKTEKGEPNKS